MTSHLLPTYARVDLAFERGEGVWLIATNGERYLDFGSGRRGQRARPCPSASGRGASTEQAEEGLMHVSNLYRIPEAERLAARLCEASFADTVFFANSGAEAMECAIKMARKYQSANGEPERFRIITFEGAFHGRTLATLAAGGNKKYLEGFGPVVDGFDQVPFGDLEAVKRGDRPGDRRHPDRADPGRGRRARWRRRSSCARCAQLCDEHGLLLVFDEVQTGIGRTGELFAYQRAGVTPDIMAVAKGLGGGFPLGACLATAEAAKGMTAGTHGSTFGGNPLAMAAGNAVLDVVLAPGFLDHVRAHRAAAQAAARRDQRPLSRSSLPRCAARGCCSGSRGRAERRAGRRAARREACSTVAAGDNVVRLLPPLIVERGRRSPRRCGALDRACAALSNGAQARRQEPAG